MKRGDFVTAAMPGDLGKPRPALVVQSDVFSEHATVTILLVSVRISAIVDAHFSLIVDGDTASRRTRRGGAQALGLNVAQSSTISLKRPPVAPVMGLVFGLI